MSIFLTLIFAANCMTVLALALCSLNRMSAQTSHGMRLAVALLAVGGFSGLVRSFEGAPDVTEWLLAQGLALAMLADRRHGPCPCAVSSMAMARKPMERNHGT